jgi:hypothetical protein
MLTVRKSGANEYARGNYTVSDDVSLAVARHSGGAAATATDSDCSAAVSEALMHETLTVLCVALTFVAPQTCSWKRFRTVSNTEQ